MVRNVAKSAHPVAPKRSVLIAWGSWPAVTRRSAAASTKPDGPQMKIAGFTSGPQVAAAITPPLRRPYETGLGSSPAARAPADGVVARPAGVSAGGLALVSA